MQDLEQKEVFDEFEKERAVKKLEKELWTNERDFKMRLKKRFMHIRGMIPRFTKFGTTAERLDSWQTTLTID